jgi:hypothetical protein
MPPPRHYVQLPDLTEAKARDPAELGYVSVYIATYTEGNKRSIREIASLPWNVDAFKAAGLLTDDVSMEAQCRAAASWCERQAIANTLTGEAEYEAQVMGHSGTSRHFTRRFRCSCIAESSDGEAGSPTPGAASSLEEADATAALPGARAVISTGIQLARSSETVVSANIRSMEMLQGVWHQEHDRLRQDIALARATIAERDATIRELHQLIRDLMDSDTETAPATSPVPPEIIREAGAEIGSTLKAAAMHWMGLPTELSGVVQGLAGVDPAIRSKIMDPKFLAGLNNPANRDMINTLITTMKAAS